VDTRKEIAMKVMILGVMGLMLLAGMAEAQQAGTSIEQESGSVFTSILHVVIKWIFPVCAAYCFLHGVIGKGVKRGEWDMAAICVIASVALALFPKMLTALFKVNL
jgi:hypothetical protein